MKNLRNYSLSIQSMSLYGLLISCLLTGSIIARNPGDDSDSEAAQSKIITEALETNDIARFSELLHDKDVSFKSMLTAMVEEYAHGSTHFPWLREKLAVCSMYATTKLQPSTLTQLELMFFIHAEKRQPVWPQAFVRYVEAVKKDPRVAEVSEPLPGNAQNTKKSILTWKNLALSTLAVTGVYVIFTWIKAKKDKGSWPQGGPPLSSLEASIAADTRCCIDFCAPAGRGYYADYSKP